ncbi:MAG: hypothetical protein ACR2LF_09610 [Jatrophihabitantaceae bacterium]
MSRRASLPGAAELFRATSAPDSAGDTAVPHPGVGAVPPLRSAERVPLPATSGPTADARTGTASVRTVARSTRRVPPRGERGPSGRERHEEKITVYCSPEELLDLETSRLHLRAEHGLAVDRGRIVREALAVVLADLEAKGEASILVRRLRES